MNIDVFRDIISLNTKWPQKWQHQKFVNDKIFYDKKIKMNNEKLEIIREQIFNLSKEYFDIKAGNTNFVPGISKIPVSGKVLSSQDLLNTIDASLDMWYTSGRFTEQFEKLLAKKLNQRHALFVNSGSSANLLALSSVKELYKLSDGDEIITAAVGFPTTINPIIQNNLKPVLVDVELDTLNIDPYKIEKMINEKTKGIVIAHVLGNPFNLNLIMKIIDKYNLFLIEDNCDAFGSLYNDTPTGTFGVASTLSFYPAHHITTGEGGAVITSNTKLKKIMESIRDWGRDCYCPPGVDKTCKKRFDWQLGDLPLGYDHKYIYSHVGYNLKSSDLQASLGVSQINQLDSFRNKRIENYEYLHKKFSEFNSFRLIKSQQNSEPSWFGFPVLIKENQKFSRQSLLKHYDEHNIGTRLLFGGNLKKQPAYKGIEFKYDNLSNADYVLENAFWLGVYPGLSFDMLDYVYEATKEFLQSYAD